jgi:dinuclear metal center YbgI/SA1388 family protein
MPSGSIDVDVLTTYLDQYLKIAEVPDSANAWNGVQVERRGPVRQIAFAVDAAQATIDAAARQEADLLIVHHGLFWDGILPVTGRRYKRLHSLLTRNIGLYSAHLPLDVHKEVGNNIVLARRLGIEVEGSFADYRGTEIGVYGALEIRREALAARLDELLGVRVRMVAGGSERVRRVGIVTGSGGNYVEAARELGLDAYVTGEGAHHNYFDAMEGGINLYLAGHYATEVWGLQALAAHLTERFQLTCFFLEHPTGL